MTQKIRLQDLAILGGQPAFDEPLYVGRPNVGDRQRLLVRINDLLDRRWLSNDGPYVQELERELSRLIGVRHCVAVCNGTIALELAIRAAGLSDKVIVPSFTFVATAHALQWQGITPVFADIDAKTHNIDPVHVEALIDARTTGILGVHLWGRPCDVHALADIARRHRLPLLFDAAHALGCSHEGRMVGGFGDAEVFSFHATKSVNTFEGGAVATNGDALAARVRAMRNFGFAGEDRVTSVGINGKMSEVAAAMGLTSLESMAEFTAINHRNYALYRRQLADVPGLQLLGYDESEHHNYQFVVLEIDAATSDLSRDELRDVLRAEGVLARRYFYPGCHHLEPYRSSGTAAPLENTDAVAARVLSLPTGTGVRPEDIDEVCRISGLPSAAPAICVLGSASRGSATGGPRANDMSKPLVSVIIPVWNAGPYIAETVESVLEQTHRRWELIVADDGSTDDTVERLAPYQDSLRLIRKRHGGSAAARNAGLDAARGDYVVFLDADDLWYPTKLEVQLAVARRHPESGLVVCEGIEFEGDRVLQTRLVGGPFGERLRASTAGEITGWFYRELVCQPLSAGASSMLIPRAVAERVGRQIPTPGLAPDWDYTLRIARDYPITGHLDSLVRWRYRPSSQSGVRDRRLFRWTLLQVRTLRRHLRLCRNADRAFVAAILRRRASEGARQLYYYGRTHELAYARTSLALLARSIPGNPIVLICLLAAWLPSSLVGAAAWLRRSARRAKAIRAKHPSASLPKHDE